MVVEVLWGAVRADAVVLVVKGWGVASDGLDSVLVVSTVVFEGAVVFATELSTDLAVEVMEDASEVEDFLLVGSGPFKVSDLSVELLEGPISAGSAEVGTRFVVKSNSGDALGGEESDNGFIVHCNNCKDVFFHYEL